MAEQIQKKILSPLSSLTCKKKLTRVILFVLIFDAFVLTICFWKVAMQDQNNE